MTFLAPITCTKSNEKSKMSTTLEMTSKNIEDIKNIVVMSGSAKRRRFEKKENKTEVKITQENFEENFLKLRAPFSKPHPRQAVGEKLMTKSCEALLECIKPYKDIRMTRKTQVTESIQTVGRILTTDIIYERKATRKVQFFDFLEENSEQNLPSKKRNLLPVLPETPSETIPVNTELHDETEPYQNQTSKTVSSEDFVTNVFSVPKPMFI